MIFLMQQRNWCILESSKALEAPSASPRSKHWAPSTTGKNKRALRSSGQSPSSSTNITTGSIGHELTHLAACSFWEVLFHVSPFHTQISRSFPRGWAEPRVSPCMAILPVWNSPVQGNKNPFNCMNFHQGTGLSGFQKQFEKSKKTANFKFPQLRLSLPKF